MFDPTRNELTIILRTEMHVRADFASNYLDEKTFTYRMMQIYFMLEKLGIFVNEPEGEPGDD